MFLTKASIVIVVAVVLTIVTARPDEVPVIGGVKNLSGDDLKDAEQVLNASLTKLAAGDGPNYQLGRVISASHQVVSGSLYKYVVELVDKDKATKKCNVNIWSQPWLENGIEVTFDCEGAEKVVKKHSA